MKLNLHNALLSFALSACCTEQFDHFEWRFPDANATEWDVLEGAQALGSGATIRTIGGNPADNDASCSGLWLTLGELENAEFAWSLDAFVHFPPGHTGDLAGADVDVVTRFVMDPRLCAPRNEDDDGFVLVERPSQLVEATWSSSGDFTTSATIRYEMTIEVPPVDPSVLDGFPDCPNENLLFRFTGTSVGLRNTVNNNKCPTSN